MSDQAVLLPKWSPHGRIILAKGQLDRSYIFWIMPIMITVLHFVNKQKSPFSKFRIFNLSQKIMKLQQMLKQYSTNYPSKSISSTFFKQFGSISQPDPVGLEAHWPDHTNTRLLTSINVNYTLTFIDYY